MKRILGVVVTGLLISSLPQSAVASVHAVAKVTCKATKSIAHTPKEVATPKKVLPGKIGSFTLVTNCGNIVIKTDGVKAPVTLTALTTLAKGGFYDHSLCHRVTTTQMWVLQCGDPTAKGNGGPAFSFQDENLPMTEVNNYPSGTVAMANSGNPGTNGSQFFLVYGDTTLPANYTIWGTITSGLNILKAIGAAGIKGGGTDGTPVKTIAIEKVIVK
ncbi:unannotated protein [freshwater metagenome]|jgi:peptidyl-prolyl cis-trans isomerase B (cyclophilin B)|uniref:Unannotated protein n=1 Tax=freshwater metagenome TaxID=449393 RepID=A0A6J7H948_9ZZZZ|nr:peptidylprolyl isomerase [Actinomycetota bacterium]MSW57306.1 peptidylprolyl isomerase [Actinomycetota bacterium]MSX47971.1 peptidylprolyl isomerase [Actinomycetota bacterium]MSX62067.1 peptidylprolyl isomerase [Actinomycetota bacterium]MSY09272.1 peptidylprolyl isomerase [Actinomycetota bacterium]